MTLKKHFIASVFVLTLGLVVLVFSFFPSQASADWEVVGNAGFSAGEATYPKIFIDGNNVPYVAYRDDANINYYSTIKKFNGTTWDVLGSEGVITGYDPYLAFDTSNVPYVAFRDATNSNKATVKKFNGTSWVVVGSAGFSAGMADYNRIAFTSDNIPYVVFRDGSGGFGNIKATAMKLNGDTWEVVGGARFSAGDINSLSIAFDGDNVLYVAYSDVTNSYKSTVMKLNGSSWSVVGAVGFSSGRANGVSLAIDGNDIPYVAYSDTVNAEKATVMKLNGSSWGVVDTVGFSSGAINAASIKIDGDNVPYVAIGSNVMKFNGTSWEVVGTATAGGSFDIDIDGNNIPYIITTEAVSYKLSVMKYVAAVAPTITTNVATDITATSVTLNGTITNNGGENPEIYFDYGPDTNYEANGDRVGGTMGEGDSFSTDITGLTCGTTYHYRAVGVNSAGEGDGDSMTFTTSTCSVDSTAPTFGAHIGTTGTPGGTTTIGVTVNDNESVASAEISFDDGDTYEPMTETPASINRNQATQRRYTYDLDIPENQTANIDYTIRAYDGEDNPATLEDTIVIEIETPAPTFAGGAGTLGSPYQISTCQQLEDINYTPDDGDTFPFLTEGKYFILNNDIDCSDTVNWNDGAGFMPIGQTGEVPDWNSYRQPFYGFFDGDNHKISGLYIYRPNLYDGGLFGEIYNDSNDASIIKNLNIIDADIKTYGNSGILAGQIEYADISHVSATGQVDTTSNESPATFHISQLKDNKYEEEYSHHYGVKYSTENFDFNNLKDSLTLKINQNDLPFASIDAVSLNACEIKVDPLYAKNKDGINILDDISSIDNNVADAHEKDIEISWSLPSDCTSATLSLTADEYGDALPFEFSNSNNKYILGTNNKTLTIDGKIDEVKDMTPTYSPYWVPSTGHPEGNVYFYVTDDTNYLYLSADIAIDNTDDVGSDWMSLTINGKRFKIDDNDSTYGMCAFVLTDKVSWKHQTCEMRIPKNEINTTKPISFILNYYGTLGQGGYTGGLIGGSDYSNINNTFSNVNVRGVSSVGGLIGYSDSDNISNSYAFGDVEGQQYVGGLIGGVSNYDSSNVILNSYSIGSVTGETNVGGLIGDLNYNFGTYTDDYVKNSGWYQTQAETNMKGIGYTTEDEDGAEVTYKETNNTVFYSKNHGVYALGQEGGWDFDTTPIWYEYTDNYPQFVAQGGIIPTPTHHHSQVIGTSSGAIRQFQEKQTPPVLQPTIPTSTPIITSITLNITRLLKLNMTGDDVKALQVYLNTHGFPIALTGAGSLGHETTKFGLLTKKAVIAFQKAHNLTPDGIVGPKTLEKMK